MYEDQTQEVIEARVLARIPDSLDKREGSLIQTAIGPVVAELTQMYIELDGAISESFADTATRDNLIRRAAESGVNPYPATAAMARGEFNLNDITLGTRFRCGDYIYYASEKIEDGVYLLTCETVGSAPNGTTGTLVPLETVAGLTSAEIVSIPVPGTDDEDTEVFRQRYYDSFESQAFGGNRADYKEKTLAISGVGAVKTYRATSITGDEGTEGGNVCISILNSSYGAADATLIALVKNTLDPPLNSGYGYGLAPIWHHVYVASAGVTTVNITITATFKPGYSFAILEDQIKDAVDAYFLTLAKSWEDEDYLIVRKAYIQNAILAIEGVVDVEVTAINGVDANLSLDPNNIPTRGTITCS